MTGRAVRTFPHAAILPSMAPIVLFEDYRFGDLLPLLFWRSVFELRLGRKIVMDRAAQRLNAPIAGIWTRDWIASVAAQRCGAPANKPLSGPTLLINGRWLFDSVEKFPETPCVGTIGDDIAFVVCDAALASRVRPEDLLDVRRCSDALSGVPREPASGRMIRYPWDVVCHLGDLLRSDWRPGDATISSKCDPALVLEPTDQIHVGERTCIHRTAVIDASQGPIFVGDDVSIGALAVIEGPAYIGPGSRVHPHSWLHGGNAIGPVCKVGGEICGCVINGYTNKQHAGFLGHAYVGSWVNIGAGAVNSDLKNTYGTVRVPVNGHEVDSGRRFFGAIIGDHAKIGINATIPTGGVIGFAASVASTAPLPKFVPSLSWVTPDAMTEGDPARALDLATRVMARRDIDMTDEEIELFLNLKDRIPSFEVHPPS